ncbi:MAG: D-tagatose-bisphosphate aldolase, class II, non-catalytic subunit [Enterobacteriaceae bacterium]
MQRLLQRIQRNKAGEATGVPAICCAHPWVLESALSLAKERSFPLVIEATCNQVNQFGGYTGMTPKRFRDFVHQLAQGIGLADSEIILGGDHLGPNPWCSRPAAEAMSLAEGLVHDYVLAGFRKIHLDCSMSCLGDPLVLDDQEVAQRAARLCSMAEKTWQTCGGEAPRYVIGTEVPVPGGAHEESTPLAVTQPQAALTTLEVHQQVWQRAGLEAAWERVIALVVQPGVEFSNHHVHRYQPEQAAALSRSIDAWPQVFEAHSTDYQSVQACHHLVRDHFAILKVGPALTFALREGLFALDRIDLELNGELQAAHLRAVLDQVMQEEPQQWLHYYRGHPHQQYLDRHYSLSDRIRYYWPHPQVQQAVNRLLDNLSSQTIPFPLISQYLPEQARALSAGQLDNQPRHWVRHKIQQTLLTWVEACEP